LLQRFTADGFADILVITCTYTFHHNCHILYTGRFAVFTLYTTVLWGLNLNVGIMRVSHSHWPRIEVKSLPSPGNWLELYIHV